jgi:hypothetical protein
LQWSQPLGRLPDRLGYAGLLGSRFGLLLPDLQGGEVDDGLEDRLRSRRLEDWLWGSWLFGGLQGYLLLLLLFPLALTLLVQPEHPGKVGFDLGLSSRDRQDLVALIRHQ